MPNFPIELSLSDTPIQQKSTTLRRRTKSFSTTNLVKYNNSKSNIAGEGRKNRKTTTLLLQEYQEEEEEEDSPIEGLIQQLRSELQQTRALVSELESRLELTEQTSQVIVGELKNLLSESESNATAVEIDQESDIMKMDLDNDEFCITPSFMNQTHQEELNIDNEQDIQNGSTATSSESSIIQHADDTNDSFNRICSALQNLINDAQVALQKPNSSSSHQLLELPQTTTRPRAQSWSSNVSSWIMNHYNPTPVVACECGSCWLCLEPSSNSLSSTTTTTRTTPKSSRANSISSVLQRPSLTFQKQESDKSQVHLAGIKKQYRKKLERRFDYRKSCDDLEVELQKLITTAISTGMEHGLMHSPVHRQYQFHDGECMEHDDSCDSYFTHKDKLLGHNYFRNRDDEETSDESYDEDSEEKFSRFRTNFPKSFEIFCKCEQFKELENNNNNNNDNEMKSSKWRRRFWDYLQRVSVKFSNYRNKSNYDENVEDENENSSYGSYSSYNSSWNSSSCDDRENSNEDSANPFPSSFINTLNLNVNLINSTTNNYSNKTTNNYLNEIDNSTRTTSTTNNYYIINNNNHEEKSPQLNSAKDVKEGFTFSQPTSKKLQSLTSKYMNLLAMMGLMISMSQSILSKPTTTSSFMNIVARNIIRSGTKGRRSGSDMILMIKVVKYAAVLFVGWAAGRIGKKQKESSDKNNRITEIPSNNTSNY